MQCKNHDEHVRVLVLVLATTTTSLMAAAAKLQRRARAAAGAQCNRMCVSAGSRSAQKFAARARRPHLLLLSHVRRATMHVHSFVTNYYLPTYLLTYLPTYLPTYISTYLPTYLISTQQVLVRQVLVISTRYLLPASKGNKQGFFPGFFLCNQSGGDDHPENHLAKFGYILLHMQKSRMKTESFYFLGYPNWDLS